MTRIPWASRLPEAQQAFDALGGPKAAVELTKRWGVTVTPDALVAALRRGRQRGEVAPMVPVVVPGQVPEVAAVPAPAAAPEPDPLAEAYQQHEERVERRSEKKQIAALLEENTRLKAEAAELRAFRSKAPEILVYDKAKEHRADAIACAIASDWHVEETVDKASVHGLNEYNLEIAKSRAEHFFRNLLRLTDMMARDSQITTIYIAMLGDFFSGWIHEELLAACSLAPGDAARFCKGLWVSGIDFLLRESSYVIDADAIPGNHGRMTKQVHFSDPTGTSLETVMYESIADRYWNNPRVRINVSSQAMVYRRMFERFVIRLCHGYEMKFGGGVGGITIPVRKAIAQWNNGVRADLTAFGHFHQKHDGGDFLCNSSLIGYNLYAQNIKAGFEEPTQTFWLTVARNGGQKSLTAPIWLDDAHRAGKEQAA